MSKSMAGQIQEDKIITCNKYGMSPGIYHLNILVLSNYTVHVD